MTRAPSNHTLYAGAAVIALAQLLAFHQVVSDNVERAASERSQAKGQQPTTVAGIATPENTAP